MSINSGSPDALAAPLIHPLQPITLRNTSNNQQFGKSKLHKRVSIKDVFANRKQNLTLEELAQDDRYSVYYLIFRRIRWIILILGLWAPNYPGWPYWCLRNLYPALIYFFILYPWTTFLTQESYWSVPVFLFINLHLSGIFAYRSARKYWKQKPNHLINFITSTFIPFYDDISHFQRSYEQSQQNDELKYKKKQSIGTENDKEATTLQMGFQQRYKKDNRKRKRMAKSKFHQYGIGIGLGALSLHSDTSLNQHSQNKNKNKNRKRKRKIIKSKEKIDNNNNEDVIENKQFDIHQSLQQIRAETSDPYKQKEEQISSWSNIAGHENKLSLSLFYEATQRLWYRFWIVCAITAIPIAIILLVEIMSTNLHSSISTHSNFKSQIFTDIFIPFNTVLSFVRIFYNIGEFVFMALYFQFICECHRGDLLIHLHYYDTSDIDEIFIYCDKLSHYKQLEYRLASIVWDWDRIASSTRDTSKAFRWWILVMILFNFIAGVTAIVNLLTQNLNVFPQHLEMYMPAIVNLMVSFYLLYCGTKISHLNKIVQRRTYFLLANAHFGNVEILSSIVSSPVSVDVSMSAGKRDIGNDIGNDNENKQNDEIECMDEIQTNLFQANINSIEMGVRKQNLYIQSQTVARAVTNRRIGISVYGLVLNRNLFLAFFSPFVAFFLFCINMWLPN